jgi:biopolymer transport protein ExbD
MIISFRCPVCSAQLGGHDDQIGRTISCPACGSRLQVPDATENAHDKELVAEESAIHFGAWRHVIHDEMDMTPMVDVTFLLLIFFMVTAAFSLQKSFEVPTPDQEQPSAQVKTLQDFEDDPNFVVVRVDQFNTYHVSAAHWDEEREAPSEQDLLVSLGDARQGDGRGHVPTQLLVIAHGDSLHEKVVTALDAGTAVGMEDVKLITVEEDQS